MKNSIYKLKLFEKFVVDNVERSIEYERAPGGWVRNQYVEDIGITSCFIPYSAEFKDISYGCSVDRLGGTIFYRCLRCGSVEIKKAFSCCPGCGHDIIWGNEGEK